MSTSDFGKRGAEIALLFKVAFRLSVRKFNVFFLLLNRRPLGVCSTFLSDELCRLSLESMIPATYFTSSATRKQRCTVQKELKTGMKS